MVNNLDKDVAALPLYSTFIRAALLCFYQYQRALRFGAPETLVYEFTLLTPRVALAVLVRGLRVVRC